MPLPWPFRRRGTRPHPPLPTPRQREQDAEAAIAEARRVIAAVRRRPRRDEPITALIRGDGTERGRR